jgi:hypothetical protein
MYNLITSYYTSVNTDRQKEIDESLLNNTKNENIKKIYLLNDKIYDLEFLDDKTKIEQNIVNETSKQRLRFDYAIEFINEKLTGEICILSNSDIYFDDTLKLLNNTNYDNIFIALSRYEHDKLYNKALSQDSWIFMSPLKVNIKNLGFCFGILGCDNRIAYIAHEHKYKVINPSKTIKSHHLHDSKYRTYSIKDRVKGLYLSVSPHILNHQPIIKVNTNFK